MLTTTRPTDTLIDEIHQLIADGEIEEAEELYEAYRNLFDAEEVVVEYDRTTRLSGSNG